jgi:rhodanese-related sulfurtransferase
MTVVKQAIIELILLTVASVGVALAANQIRERKSIELTKNHFNRGSSNPRVVEKNGEHAPVSKSAASEVVKPPGANGAAKKHLDHNFQTITVDEAHEALDDPKTAQGLNVFVDARDDEHFAEGHIPGAIQCFPYESRRCLDRVVAAANGAEKVIVYCGGGDCEDSIYMSRELNEAGVPEEAIYLFEGGWKEWAAKDLHVETGM